MRKLIILLAAVLALVSCNNDKPKDYTFLTQCYASPGVTTEATEAITAYVRSFPFFMAPRTIPGTYSDASQVITQQFLDSVDELDEEEITKYLEEGQAFAIYLLLEENMAALVGVYFTPEGTQVEE